jgi:hypothetical protein
VKIIYLNAWDATVREPFINFVKHHAADTDIFCFQEADDVMPGICDELLSGYIKLAAHKYVTEPDNFYLVTYVRDGIDILSSGTLLENEENVGLGQYVQVGYGSDTLYVCNFHGMSRPIDKSDTPERLHQTKGLTEFFTDKTAPRIIGSDFNVFPNSGSIPVFRENGYRDLIADYKITNTRNHLVWDRYPENPKQYFSDYIFVSDGVRIDEFSVPDVEVSDHLPLIIRIS